jgi:lysophospholipase L1-like esterase
MRRSSYRFIVALATVAVAALLLEVGLRVALLAGGSRAIQPTLAAARHTILCLGDSHTYGLTYSEAEAYPGQLERILNQRAPGRYRVINLALPGMNSTQIVSRLPAWIARYQPMTVIVSAGLTNFWNRADPQRHHQASRLTRWLYGLQLYRAYRLWGRSLSPASDAPAGQTGRADVDEVPAGGQADVASLRDRPREDVLLVMEGYRRGARRSDLETMATLRRDLAALLELTEQHAVQLVVLTYAASLLPGRLPHDALFGTTAINETLSRFGQEHGVPVVDVRRRFRDLLTPGTPRSAYFASLADPHPNPQGYLEIARLVAEMFERDAPRPAGAAGTGPHADPPHTYSLLNHTIEETDIVADKNPWPMTNVLDIRIGPTWESSLFQHPNSRIAFRNLEIAKDAELRFAVGIHPGAWDQSGDGVLFEASIFDGPAVSRVFTQYIDPKHRIEHRKWLDARVDLAPFGGRKIVVVFKTSVGPQGNSDYDWAVWGNPRIVWGAGKDLP